MDKSIQNKRFVTSEEIQKLYQFTRQHYVEYYDLQTELVDHLATGMEENWEKDPALDFNQNLNREFKKFGVFGFMDVVEKKQKAMEKRYLKLIWQEIKKKLAHPVIGTSFIGSTLLLTYSLQWELTKYIILFLLLALVIFILIKTTKMRRQLKSQQKVYLLEAMILQTGGYLSIGFFPLHLYNFINPIISNGTDILWIINLFLGLFTSSCFLFCWVAFYTFPHKKEEILNRFYPERKVFK